MSIKTFTPEQLRQATEELRSQGMSTMSPWAEKSHQLILMNAATIERNEASHAYWYLKSQRDGTFFSDRELRGTPAYGWIITRDHIDGKAQGTIGPSNVDPAIEAILKADKGSRRNAFKIYDDDGELYYSGYLVWDQRYVESDEEALAAPLRDYATKTAGATLVKYPGHPDWACEY